jgi:hypothetical protein
MDKARFLTIFPTFESIDVVQQTLPTVIDETERAGARLIVHDSSVNDRHKKWEFLRAICTPPHAFLMLTDPISMAHARNACLHLGVELYCPDVICMLEDDHGYRVGFIDDALDAVDAWYGKPAPNGLRFGMFTGCDDWPVGERGAIPVADTAHRCPHTDEDPGPKGGCHNGCRIAPTHHWQNVLRGYDVDEYPISRFQTSVMGYRNYHRGFTRMIINGGGGVFMLDRDGHGVTDADAKRWDDHFCASDPRARFRRTPDLAGAADAHDPSHPRSSDHTRAHAKTLFPINGMPAHAVPTNGSRQ